MLTNLIIISNLAAFLGDAVFPRIIMSANKGEKIVRFQNLYKTYSGLAFTKPYDRPIALDGIQNKLLKAFGTHGGFGIFDEDRSGQGGLLRRSLLWYRSQSAELVKIKFLPSSTIAVPSWSWMAYIGEIDYLKLEFGNMDWKEIQSPWSDNGRKSLPTDSRSGNIALIGEVRDIAPDAAGERAGKIYFDVPGVSRMSQSQCVVLGVEQRNLPESLKLHYFILVAPTSARGSDRSKAYERIGAGYLPGRCISSQGRRMEIH
jgi:hypothetical protein